MSKKGFTAMLAVATLTGYIHTFAAQEHSDANQLGASIPENNIVVQKPLVDTSAPVAVAPAPAPVLIPPAEKLLSEMKVYPTF
ncbi:MAG: hypothetical protein Q7J84_13985 [Sulfuricaulis sp.]|nr:hypothetical protein [Sulfuricaulis sp.]